MPVTIATPRTIANAVSDRAELAPGEALERDADHVRASSFIAASISVGSDAAELVARSGRRPGRGSRSAIAAARASCVTITVVWP